MSRISEEDINEIRKRADIADIIQRYIPLVKKGKNFAAVCPFHDDHDPSLSINVDKQIFKCFVCGEGGNVFNFVKSYEKISFSESVVKVANYVNYSLSTTYTSDLPQIAPEHQRLHKLLKETINYTQYLLATQDTIDAKNYLTKRGILELQIKKFEIGLNLDKLQTTQFLQAKGFSLQECVSANVTRLTDNGPSDVFYNRILFPIHDALGNPVGFSARTLNPNESSKYINSSETPVYVKGKLLYNYHRAISTCKKQKQIILVEGVTDVLAFDRAEVFNVVATLGTACTSDQIRLIQQASTNVLLCYDGDEAGLNAAYKIGKLLNTFHLNVEVIINNTGLDPDEISQKKSLEALRALVQVKQGFTDFVFSYLLKKFDMNNYTQKKEFAKLMMSEINNIKDEFDQNNLLLRLSETTGFESEQLKLLSVKLAYDASKPSIISSPTVSVNSIRQWADFEILGMMLKSLQAAIEFKDKLGFLPNPQHNTCALLILDYYRKNETIIVADFINTIEDPAMLRLMTDLSANEIYYKDYNEVSLNDAMIQVKISLLDEKMNQIKQLIKNELELNEHQRYLKSMSQLREERQALRKEIKGA
jgi:DNA primase